MKISFFLLFILAVVSAGVSGQPMPYGENIAADELISVQSTESAGSDIKYWKTFAPSFIGTLDFGRETSMPCWPETSSFNYGMGGAPVTGYGFGVGMDYRPMKNLAFFFDITAHSWKFQVAEEGSHSEGDWVFEQTDYSTRFTGEFNKDVWFFMNTTQARLGARYIFPVNEKVEPWFGIGYGFSTWTGNFLTADKKSTYGNDTGTGVSLSYLAGIDFYIGEERGVGSGFLLTLFIDVGSPVAKPIEINDLFYDGWTWESTAGEHAILPYRIGLAFSL